MDRWMDAQTAKGSRKRVLESRTPTAILISTASAGSGQWNGGFFVAGSLPISVPTLGRMFGC